MWDKRCCRAVWCLGFVLGSCYFLWKLVGCPGFLLPVPNFLPLVPTNVSTAPPPYPLQTLPPADPTTLIDLKEFAFLSSPSCSSNSTPLIVAIVHSAPGNVNHRQVIRSTWGSHYKLIFMVGETNSSDLTAQLDQEIRNHGDVVQGTFLDSYRNLTYKHVMALKWVAYQCQRARYVLKTDDDVFVNVANLGEFLRHHLSPLGARKLLMCELNANAFVHRSFRSKWRVAPSEYSGRYYPNFCTGWAILYSPDVVFKLYSEAQRAPYFWVDDVHITGTMASLANITHTDMKPLLKKNDDCQRMVDAGELDENFLFGLTHPHNIEELWKLHEAAKTKNFNYSNR